MSLARERVVVPDHVGVSRLPVDRVVRVSGATAEQLAVAVDPLPDGGPLIVHCRLKDVAARPAAIVADVLDQLERVARQLLPAWLPGAAHIETRSGVDRRAARDVARRLATSTDHFGAFLVELADAAVMKRPVSSNVTSELRARGLARVLRDSYRCDGLAMMLSSDDPLAPDQQTALAAGAEWLANHAPMGVWLTGGNVQVLERFPARVLSLPAFVTEMAPSGAAEAVETVAYPPRTGLPHPASRTELGLEEALSRCEWAHGRSWNELHQPELLAPVIRVDLMWRHERCVVELDGPDHRGALKYADDRRRDNALQLQGFSVLRFTNEQVSEDLPSVLAVICQLLSDRREGMRV